MNKLKSVINVDKVKTMSSYDAVNKMTHLQKYDKQNMVNHAVKIYNDLDKIQKNEFVIRALLNCCKKQFKHKINMDQLKLINDIKYSLIENRKNDKIDLYNKTILIGIYSKCKDIKSAISLFDSIAKNKQNIVCVSAMMQCFINNNENAKAISLYEQSRLYVKHDDVSNLLLIKACNIGDYNKAKQLVNSKININDINKHSIKLLTTLIDFYGKNGDIDDAFDIFNNIPKYKKDVACVGAMMKCFIESDENEKAMTLYEIYNGEHDDTTNLLFIKACGNNGNFSKCKQLINSKINVNNLDKHSIEFITTFIDFYGKSGDIDAAFSSFINLPTNKQDIVCLNVVMKCLIEKDQNEKAMLLYEQYSGQHNDRSHLLYIKACNNTVEHSKANKIIANISDINNRGIELINNVIDFYGKSGDMTNAIKLFDSVPASKKDVVSIGTMMKCFIDNDEYEKVISLYEEYDGQHDDVTNLLFIKACSNSGYYDKCEKVISNISGIHNCSIELINTLVDFYGKSGNMNNALDLFHNIAESRKDIVSINTMMDCFIDNDEHDKAILLYEQYDEQCNDTTNLLFLKACINIGDYNKGKKIINSKINLKNINNYSMKLVSTLIDFYGKSGDVDDAFDTFSNIASNKDNISCVAAMMNVYNNNQQYDKAINLLNEEKQKNNICLNEYISCILLDIAGNAVSPHFGSSIIDDLNQTNNIHLLRSLKVKSAIIRMYAKCSQFDEAINIFNNINLDKVNKFANEDRNNALFLYASILDCYGKMGNIDELLSLFNKLKQDKSLNKYIDQPIYCIVVNACSHSNRITEALSIFEEIKSKRKHNNIHPHIITALIDCIGRNNSLDDAQHLYKTYAETNVNMYHKFKLMMLLSLLSSCRIHKDVERGQGIFDMMTQIGLRYELGNDVETAMHIQLSNIYGENRDFDKVNEIREIMRRKRLRKTPGISWIELDGKMHTFMVNDKAHPMYNEIVKEREIVKNELKNCGHIFDESVITRELNHNETIEDHLCGHSEKTAVIYGLIMSLEGTTLTIAKNLRICKDCHKAIKLISKIRNRIIKVRDKNRWHVFENGQCTCKDYF